MLPFISRISSAEQKHWIELLNEALPQEKVVPFHELSDEERSQCDIAILANPDPKALELLPNLKWVQSVWAGVEGLLAEMPNPDFRVVRMVDPQLAHTMSEAVLAWTFYLHRDMPKYAQLQRQARWQQQPMVRAEDRRVGILGLGELGQVSAQRLQANGFQVAGWSRRPKALDNVTCFHGEAGLDHLLSHSDILVCLLPLTPQTKHLLNRKNLALLPSNAGIINFARGAIIDEVSLVSALDEGAISHAVLDVFNQEPLPQEDKLWSHPKVTVLPHISAPTHPQSACQIVADNISQYRKQGIIPKSVDTTTGY
ncbi:2-hydroxyacid dehydrogenase [Marinomonas epiphytica]